MRRGFTLAELLIALLVLGVIATFTIPKVLQTQQRSQYNATAKEVISMVSGAYQAYLQENTLTASLDPPDLTPYMNYVRVRPAGQTVDSLPGLGGRWDCNTAHFCLALHNGGTLVVPDWQDLGNPNSATSAIEFMYDPDGEFKGSSGTHTLYFYVYANGRITTIGERADNTCNTSGCFSAQPWNLADWFSWD